MNTYNIEARKRENKQGLHSLYFVATLNRKKAYKSLGFAISLNEWDSKNQCLKKKNDVINFRLTRIKLKASELALSLRVENKQIDPNQFINSVFELKKYSDATDFYQFIDYFLEQKKYGTHKKSYDTLKDNLQSYSKFLTFKDIDYSFCISFSEFLKQAPICNSNNTRIKKIQYLRCILSEAVKHKKIDSNPAFDVKIKPEKTNRFALTQSELQSLEALHQQNNLCGNRQNVLSYFLFCCYTGLRFGDLLKFQKSDIIDGMIKIVQNKTRGLVSIPLNPKALVLIPEDNFKILSNQKTNAHLKEIQKTLSIKTNMTCHVARHTFATIALNKGVPIELVSDVLGHTKISTTQIYAKFLDAYRIEQMSKSW